MKAVKARERRPSARPPRKVRKPKRPETYHHGSLREALLQAAERILERDGIQGLTLRAAAREAGVSHAAPKNHFGDLAGLLSELAAVGFDRFVATMQAGVREGDSPAARMAAIGRGYVAFARAHPGPVPADVPRRASGHAAARRCARRWMHRRACCRARSGRAAARKWKPTLTLAQAASIVGRLVAGARLCHAAARRPPEAADGPTAARHRCGRAARAIFGRAGR